VAQDLAVRRQMAGGLALRSVLPVAVMAPLLMLVVGWVITRSLQPVARVRRQLSARDAADLSPVSEAGLPDEVRPLVQELNALFGRVGRAFATQRHFVADAAHELRSPLAALKLQAQALQRAPDAAGRELAAARISAGIDRATRLMEQLLSLAREEASAASGARAGPVRLADMARLALADAAPAAQSRRIDLGLQHADDAVVDGHPEALRMLLRNLIHNAVKYTPEGGRVDVGVHAQAAGGARLLVEDSGPGIDAAERERVFDRFYRVPGTESTGSGLGLAIVRAVAEQHGAQVALDASPRLGGLRVTLDLPAPQPGAGA
jgi:two-component system OmpR family sensor kinase